MTTSVILLALLGAASFDEPKKGDGPVIVLHRFAGGLVDPAKPFANFEFTLAKDGAWEMKGAMGKTRKGKLKPDEAAKWVKEIQGGGFAKLESNPALGAADEPYLDITLQPGGKKDQKRIKLEEKLAQAIEKKVDGLK
ncbi:MAG: hypothetical protein K2W96_12115 [Gemmataceae bacterium]|nr:hypothetical protein [Gemmataceae bacterium]